MKIESFDLNQKVLVIAEIGNNHEGSFALAEEMIGKAAESGADAVKFQTIIPELFVSRADSARLERLKKFQFSFDQFASLANTARKAGVIFFSTPFDLESARFLNTIQPLFKIASGDNNFYPLLEEVASFGKPMVVSTGLAGMDQIRKSYDRIQTVWARNKVSPGLALLHCIASYPAPPSQANLGAIAALKAAFPDAVIGYSDHVMGIGAATAAVAAGARVVEKHFTLDKNYSDFRDHQLSADPADMRAMVEAIRETSAMLGTGEKIPQACEADLAVAARRSIAAARDLAAGTTVTQGDLIWVRPGSGLAPGEESRLVGKKLQRGLLQGELFVATDVGA
ncbi:MAG: N-acetylneuraminate synthase family protein [Alphaproteobacteria bacterium]|nr:N-acetylneuraminate synthase family protein [Alphaproteobacteria bacterium]